MKETGRVSKIQIVRPEGRRHSKQDKEGGIKQMLECVYYNRDSQSWNRGILQVYRVYTGQTLLESDWTQMLPDAITFRNTSCKDLTFDIESM